MFKPILTAAILAMVLVADSTASGAFTINQFKAQRISGDLNDVQVLGSLEPQGGRNSGDLNDVTVQAVGTEQFNAQRISGDLNDVQVLTSLQPQGGRNSGDLNDVTVQSVDTADKFATQQRISGDLKDFLVIDTLKPGDVRNMVIRTAAPAPSIPKDNGPV